MTWKLMIVDDHEVVRLGMKKLLCGAEFAVVAMAGFADQAVELAAASEPDLILVDVRMEGGDGFAAMSKIRSKQPEVRFVVLTSYDNPTYIARAAAIGASDYLLKSCSHETLLGVLKHALSDGPLLGNSPLWRIKQVMQQTTACTAGSRLPITTRELQVLRHIGLGLSNKEIAASLKISVETVKEHVQNLLRKMNAADRTDAAVRAVRQGIV